MGVKSYVSRHEKMAPPRRRSMIRRRGATRPRGPDRLCQIRLVHPAADIAIMGLAKKLNLKDGMTLRVIGKPAHVDLDDVVIATTGKAGAIIVFVKTTADIDAKAAPFIEAARDDRLAWIAYPKAGQLGTDLNRDILWKHLQAKGIQGVRQVAIDDIWSALRFRPSP